MIFDIAMRQPIAFEQRQQKMNLKKIQRMVTIVHATIARNNTNIHNLIKKVDYYLTTLKK